MILSVSRRTDIPAFYSEWFFNRLREGYIDVRNPMNIHQVSRVKITPDVIDCIVFWTKNPKAMLARLDELNEYNYYFQFTLNPYDKKIESSVPVKAEIITAFKELSSKIGPDRVIWRYDPILITDEIDVAYHIKYFEELAKRLMGFTQRCVLSFVDLYKKTSTNTRHLNLRELDENEILRIAEAFTPIAKRYDLELVTCAENIDLLDFGIDHGHCIDPELIAQICGYNLDVKKDKNQRKECGCVESIDIGAYNTCCHGCAYCYANFNNDKVRLQSSRHINTSSLLTGEIQNDDVIKERKVCSLKSNGLF